MPRLQVVVSDEIAAQIEVARGEATVSDWIRGAVIAGLVSATDKPPPKAPAVRDGFVAMPKQPLPPAVFQGRRQLCMAPGCFERTAAFYGGAPFGFPDYAMPGGVPLCPAHYSAILGTRWKNPPTPMRADRKS
jgi:hypothetical protein